MKQNRQNRDYRSIPKKLLSALLALLLLAVPVGTAAGAAPVEQNHYQTLATDAETSAAIDTAGVLWMWGRNHRGQLGTGDFTDGASPVPVLTDVASVALKNGVVFAIRMDGTLWAWGYAGPGWLGSGAYGNAYNSQGELCQTVPFQVLDMDNTASILIGDYNVLAIRQDGSLWIWGRNDSGQLGVGVVGDGFHPQPVRVLENVVSASLDGLNDWGTVAAVRSDGSLWMWGINQYGQLGNGGSGSDTIQVTDMQYKMDEQGNYVPDGRGGFVVQAELTAYLPCQSTPVKVLDDVAAVQTCGGVTAAVKTDGSLWTWGYNGNFCLGNGGSGNMTDARFGEPCQNQPVKILDHVSTAALSIRTAAAITEDHALWMWGAPGNYRLADTAAGEGTAEPKKILTDVAAVYPGDGGNAAVLKLDGSLWTCGWNMYGQVGNGASGDGLDMMAAFAVQQETFVKVLDHVALTVPVNTTAAAVDPDGTLWMWGLNDSGQVGNGGAGDALVNGQRCQTTPARVPVRTAIPGGPFADVPVNVYYALAVRWALENGVTTGKTAQRFAPFDTCTRAQVVTFLWRAAGRPAPKADWNPYVDVLPQDYYYQPVLWAMETGITTGTSDMTFSPDQTCTRGHILTFLWRMAGAPDKTEAGGAFYDDAVRWAESSGLLEGIEGAFDPEDHCPRADVVYYLWRGEGIFHFEES